MKEIVRKAVPPDHERIRRYVIGEIAKAGDVAMRLAPSREIAKLFGVSHPTVIKALKDLVDEGFLMVKPGSLGTYTNPGKFDFDGRSKIVGLLSFDGRQVFSMRLACELGHAFTSALLKKSARYKVQSCFLNGSAADCAAELVALGLDAVVWLFPPPSAMSSLNILSASGVQVATVEDSPVSKYGAVYFDHEAINHSVASRMLDEGRRRLLLYLPEGAVFKAPAIAGVERAFSERSLAFDKDSMVFFDSKDAASLRAFPATLKRMNPDGVVFNHDCGRVWPSLRESMDVSSGCRLYSMELLLHDDMGYSGYLGRVDARFAGLRVAERLVALLEGCEAPASEPIGVNIELASQ